MFAINCTPNCDNIATNINNYAFLGNYEGHAYYTRTNKANYDTALSYANDLDGTLATINSKEENYWLRNAMSPAGSYWIGFSDVEVEGDWIWLNGHSADYTNWATGEPNNSGNNEHFACAKNNGKWTDRPASNLFFVVIEVACPCIQENTPCPVSLTVRNEGACDVELFAVIPPSIEIPITTIPPGVELVFDTAEEDMWIARANGDANFETEYTVAGCNNQSLIASPCTSIGAGSSADCSQADQNIYGFDFLGTFDGSAYYQSTSESVNYHTALDAALSIGGTLPIINSQQENDWLRDVIDNTQSYWLYLSDEGSEGNFYWLDDTPVNYTNWANYEPNNNNNNEHYGRVREDGQWTDKSASATFQTVVEVPCVSACNCSDYANEEIPNYRFLGEFDGQFYYERTTGNVDFYTAYEFALELEGTLPIITSQAQNNWLRNLATTNQSFWLAFSDKGSESDYYWLDGTNVTYTNWSIGEPSDSTATHNYARVRPDGLWTNKSAFDQFSAIVAIPCPCDENTASCDFELNCPKDLMVLCQNGQGANVSWNAPTLPPNCTGFIEQISGPAQGSLFLEGTTTTIMYLYISQEGTASSCSFTITIPNCEEGARLDKSKGNCGEDAVICDINAAPNPTHDFVNISYIAHHNLEANISLYDVTGQRLISQNMMGEKGVNYLELNLSTYPKGIYYAQVQMKGVTETVKVIKL